MIVYLLYFVIGILIYYLINNYDTFSIGGGPGDWFKQGLDKNFQYLEKMEDKFVDTISKDIKDGGKAIHYVLKHGMEVIHTPEVLIVILSLISHNTPIRLKYFI